MMTEFLASPICDVSQVHSLTVDFRRSTSSSSPLTIGDYVAELLPLHGKLITQIHVDRTVHMFETHTVWAATGLRYSIMKKYIHFLLIQDPL